VLGARPRVVRLFVGPAILRFEVRGIRFELGVFPTGGFVNFNAGEVDAFAQLHPLSRAAVAAAGNFVLIAIGFALGAALGSFVRGFEQCVIGAIQPGERGAQMLRSLFSMIAQDPVYAAGVLAMKVAAFNLLPLPSLNGFQILWAVAALIPSRRDAQMPAAFAFVGVVLLLAIFIGWTIALYFAVRT
jgi:hypothetical protein